MQDANGHCALLYSGMEQIGWDGNVRPADARPAIDDEWPESLSPDFDAYVTVGRLGPLG